jgi:hypothetical protein
MTGIAKALNERGIQIAERHLGLKLIVDHVGVPRASAN